MVQNSASRNKLRDACSHVFQGSTLDLELARFMLSAQHEELPQYNAHTRAPRLPASCTNHVLMSQQKAMKPSLLSMN